MTGLEHVVVAALPILADLSGNRTSREQAERDLNALAAENGLRIRLIEHKEAFDDSVHYDVIVRGTGIRDCVAVGRVRARPALATARSAGGARARPRGGQR